MNFKKYGKIIIVILILAAIPLTLFLVKRSQEIRKKAVATTVMFFNPAEIEVEPGKEFSLEVVADTGENTISGVKLYVVFDQTKLQGLKIEKGDWLPVELIPGSINNGLASISVGALTQSPRKGRGMVAKITFKALAPVAETKVTIAENTLVPDVFTEDNALKERIPALVKIAAIGPTPVPQCILEFIVTGPTATPTPTPTVTPTATPTATATPTPTSTPIATPTNTTTPQPTATAVPTSTQGPTATPTATGVSQPTATAQPTTTSQPTATPKPTATPVRIAQEPTPTSIIPFKPGFTFPTWTIAFAGIAIFFIGLVFAF